MKRLRRTDMPRRDGTGPDGVGATGRKLGDCSQNNGTGNGTGTGRGLGLGRGTGLGRKINLGNKK